MVAPTPRHISATRASAIGSVRAVGVRRTRRPSKSRASAASGPERSLPAIGCPPTKRPPNAASPPRTTAALVEPTSVTTASRRAAPSARAHAGIARTGTARTTSVGALDAADARRRCRAPAPARPRAGRDPARPRARRARAAPAPSEPPTRPQPTRPTFMRGLRPARRGAARSPRACRRRCAGGSAALGPQRPHDHAAAQEPLVDRRRLAAEVDEDEVRRRRARREPAACARPAASCASPSAFIAARPLHVRRVVERGARRRLPRRPRR